jgi:hypothetical protein
VRGNGGRRGKGGGERERGRRAEMGKVTLKSNGDEALSDESP